MSLSRLLSFLLLLGVITGQSVLAQVMGPCGLSGTIEERIRSCNRSVGINGEFQLVTKTLAGDEVYRGRRSRVIWSADLPKPYVYLQHRLDTICNRNWPQMGGLSGLKWKLPSIHRYLQGMDSGIRAILPQGTERVYWSSTAPGFYVNSRYVFESSRRYVERPNGTFEFRFIDIEDASAYVKCIVEPGT